MADYHAPMDYTATLDPDDCTTLSTAKTSWPGSNDSITEDVAFSLYMSLIYDIDTRYDSVATIDPHTSTDARKWTDGHACLQSCVRTYTSQWINYNNSSPNR